MKKYGISHPSTISHDQLLALKVYCDTTAFCLKFCDSFRQKENESTEEWLRKHAQYCHLAKNLREVVECFGATFSASTIFFRGIKKEFVFDKTILYFNAPTSTTLKQEIAYHFSSDQGLILMFSRMDWMLKTFYRKNT